MRFSTKYFQSFALTALCGATLLSSNALAKFEEGKSGKSGQVGRGLPTTGF